MISFISDQTCLDSSYRIILPSIFFYSWHALLKQIIISTSSVKMNSKPAIVTDIPEETYIVPVLGKLLVADYEKLQALVNDLETRNISMRYKYVYSSFIPQWHVGENGQSIQRQ